jgi:hypothetical protein
LKHNLILQNAQRFLRKVLANGLRYPRVGGRGFALRCRKNSKPEKSLKIAQTPTRRVHAVLGALTERQTCSLKKRLSRKHAKILQNLIN